MSPHVQVLLSGALTFGVPLAFAIRELIVLRRPPRNDGQPPPPVPPRPPVNRPLPDCLIPKPLPRVRQLEDA